MRTVGVRHVWVMRVVRVVRVVAMRVMAVRTVAMWTVVVREMAVTRKVDVPPKELALPVYFPAGVTVSVAVDDVVDPDAVLIDAALLYCCGCAAAVCACMEDR